jgi:diguanylate cyclase (GGDEF)-like protein/PAS domain S-box-containing protein
LPAQACLLLVLSLFVNGASGRPDLKTIKIVFICQDYAMTPLSRNKRMLHALEVARMSVWDSVISSRKILKSRILWRDHGLALLGLEPANLIQPFEEFLRYVHPDDRQYVTKTMQDAIDQQGSYSIEYRVLWPDGSLHWLAARAQIQWSGTGQSARSVGIVWDISERKEAELALGEQKELAELTLGAIGEGVITTDTKGMVTYLNRTAEQLTGWMNRDLGSGVPVTLLFRIVDETTGETVENVASKCLRLNKTMAFVAHGALVTKSGKRIPIEDSASPIRSPHGDILGAVIVFRDVSHERALKHELSWHAAHDPLTGLINRREFEAQVTGALTSAKEERHSHALMYLDLDQFKVVNDTCGHNAGDVLLKILAKMLHGHMRGADVLARLGGDEFGALLLNCPMDHAYQLANKLRHAVKDFRFAWESRTFEIGVSIGLVSINEDSKSVHELLSAADQACYAAKELGRNRVHLYEESDAMVAKRHGETMWVPLLSEALQSKRFVLYTQPIVSLNGAASEHFEVLIRMINDNGDLILPGAFIPAAERYDAMPPIDRWVIETVCGWLRDSREEAAQGRGGNAQPGAFYSINLSGSTLNDNSLGDFILEKFREYEVDATQICFEITETTAIANLDAAAMLIHRIRKLGCKFALDDFGSGFSSFAYLKMLPVDYLKIDGIFVRDITANKVNHALVSAINDVGHVMGIETIAEFVENDDILEAVRLLGIDYAQGHAVGSLKPMALRIAT